MKEDSDPITSDPILLHTWTRYVGILIALLIVLVGGDATNLSVEDLVSSP